MTQKGSTGSFNIFMLVSLECSPYVLTYKQYYFFCMALLVLITHYSNFICYFANYGEALDI